ncbi:MAG TPA: hypothetical protein VFA67_11685 [Candidatus Sulfotelmatobacter sp.]|nr:hypothetical protein [Candidatus Sulfotelmatobacter sp.]
MPRTQKPPRLREARFEDYPQIASLASRFQLHMESFSAWQHLWTNNPAYREIQDKIPIGWVLEDSQGSIAGYLGNIPLSYELQGKRLLAATTRAWVVDSPYRPYSLLLLGTYFQQSNVDLFLSTTVNSQSAAAYCTFDGIPVPTGAWDRTLFWISDYQGFAESFLRRKGSGRAKALSYPISLGAFLRDRFKKRRFQRDGHRVPVLACSGFDQRFELFWTALRKRKPNVLLAVRNQQTLDWHFKFALEQGLAWIYTVEDQSGLLAYAVFLRHDFPPIGLRRTRLVDFQSLDQERAPDFLMAMLEAALMRCRQQSIHMLELAGPTPALERTLERAAPHHRQLSSWLFYYKARTPALEDRLKDPALWEPSLFDGDSSL